MGTVIEDLRKEIDDLIKVIQDLSIEMGRLRERIGRLEEIILSNENHQKTGKIDTPKTNISIAKVLEERLSESEKRCRDMAIFIYESLRYLTSVGAKINYRSIKVNNDELIVFDIRVASRGLDNTVNKWKVFSFDKNANIYVSEFDASWSMSFDDVIDKIAESMKKTTWRPEHLRGLKRLIRRIQKTARKIGLDIVFSD